MKQPFVFSLMVWIMICSRVDLVIASTPEKSDPTDASQPDKVDDVTIGKWSITPDPRAVASGLFIKPRNLARNARLDLTVTEPTGVVRKRYPVRGGIPFHRGELQDPAKIRLVDDKGKNIPVQGKITAWWPEGTVKFLCVDFLIDLEANETQKFFLEYGTDVQPPDSSSLKISKQGGSVT
ncbi:MAG: hypothetical protein N2C12_07660, partial [Planctomycetales bacterium]